MPMASLQLLERKKRRATNRLLAELPARRQLQRVGIKLGRRRRLLPGHTRVSSS